MRNNKTKIICISILSIIVVTFIIMFILINKENNNSVSKKMNNNLAKTETIIMVPTMNEPIKTDSTWCGVFQLNYNDIKDKVVKKNIEFTPQEKVIEDLNKEDFTKDMISEESYYIKNNEYSDGKLSLKGTLYKDLDFTVKFDTLDNGDFGNKDVNISYFGINNKTNVAAGKQIDVLYYNSQNDFAILLNTKVGDEIIFCKNPEGENFNEIYERMNEKANKYDGSKEFLKTDEFKAPKLNFINKAFSASRAGIAGENEGNFTELINKKFETMDGRTKQIENITQQLAFQILGEGEELKQSKNIKTNSNIKDKARFFYIDDTFAMFLKEKEQEKPYFATRVENCIKEITDDTDNKNTDIKYNYEKNDLVNLKRIQNVQLNTADTLEEAVEIVKDYGKDSKHFKIIDEIETQYFYIVDFSLVFMGEKYPYNENCKVFFKKKLVDIENKVLNLEELDTSKAIQNLFDIMYYIKGIYLPQENDGKGNSEIKEEEDKYIYIIYYSNTAHGDYGMYDEIYEYKESVEINKENGEYNANRELIRQYKGAFNDYFIDDEFRE